MMKNLYLYSHPPLKLRDWANENLDMLNFKGLLENPSAIHILEENLDSLDSVCWNALSENPSAIHILEENLDRVNWMMLSSNTAAIHILEENLDRVNWKMLSSNTAIFEIDYNALKKKIEPFKEELIQTCFHPTRLTYYLDTYNYDIGGDCYCSEEDWRL